MDSVAEIQQKRQNRPVTLYLGNTLAEYEARISTPKDIQEMIERVEVADSLNWVPLAVGHKADCPHQLHFTPHDSYTRWARHFDRTRPLVTTVRVCCLECEAVFTIRPSLIVQYKRYDTDANEKPMTLLFIAEGSYRMVSVSQALGVDTRQEGTWVALVRADQMAILLMALWGSMQWLGPLSPAQLNLALGVEPPTHAIEDEKHFQECGEKAYMLIEYAPKEALIWWVDYIDSVSEDTLRDSLERLKALSERLTCITDATIDGWEPAQKALQGAFPGITLAECHMHALIKLGQHLATFKRQRKKAGQPVSEQEKAQIHQSFLRVLQAHTPEAYQTALDELLAVSQHESLTSRKDSLSAKQALFQAWTTDDKLALVTTALDQCVKLLNRRLDNMQTLHNPESRN